MQPVAEAQGKGAVSKAPADRHLGVAPPVEAAGEGGQHSLPRGVQPLTDQAHLPAVGVAADDQIPAGGLVQIQPLRLMGQGDNRPGAGGYCFGGKHGNVSIIKTIISEEMLSEKQKTFFYDLKKLCDNIQIDYSSKGIKYTISPIDK